jgi:hypothetical protein
MRIVNAIWWRHAYVFSICAFFQALWVTLQLRNHWSHHWCGILLWSYIAVIYWAGHIYMLMVLRGDHHRHEHANKSSESMRNRTVPERVDMNSGDSWDASDNEDNDDANDTQYDDQSTKQSPRSFSAGNLYSNDSSKQQYTDDELEAGAAYHQECIRGEDESDCSYRFRRAVDMQQLVRVALFATGLVQLILLVVKLERNDAFAWWVWWLVASIMLGVVMLLSISGAFWVPLRAWYLRTYIDGQRAMILQQNGQALPAPNNGYGDSYLGTDTPGVQYKPY